MRTAINDNIYTVDEYIRSEWPSELRHEFIGGRLFEMPHEDCNNNQVRGALMVILHYPLKQAGYKTYVHDIKVAIPNENKYYYPDIFATKEDSIPNNNDYIKYQPEIIVEVVSDSTHLTDYVDKYIDYTKIPSLIYYLVVEPEITLITVHEREDNNNWITHKYIQPDAIVKLPKLNIEFLVRQVYE